MRFLWVVAGTLVISSNAVAAENQSAAQLECENAISAQYKKDVDALYLKTLARPITVQEVMADRRLTEAYCLKLAACDAKGGAKPEAFGQNFQSCLDGEAADRQRELDEYHRDS